MIEVQKNSLPVGAKVLIHDDLLATGGTAIAAAELVNKTGAQDSSFCFFSESYFLEADKRLKNISETIISIVNYDNYGFCVFRNTENDCRNC